MKAKRIKHALCLILVFTLLSGLLLGCRNAQSTTEDPQQAASTTRPYDPTVRVGDLLDADPND